MQWRTPRQPPSRQDRGDTRHAQRRQRKLFLVKQVDTANRDAFEEQRADHRHYRDHQRR